MCMAEDSSVTILNMPINMGQHTPQEPPLILSIKINVGHIKYQPTPSL